MLLKCSMAHVVKNSAPQNISFLSCIDTSSRTSYRSRRRFCAAAHSLRCSSFPNRTRCAGLRFGVRPEQKISFLSGIDIPLKALGFQGDFSISKKVRAHPVSPNYDEGMHASAASRRLAFRYSAGDCIKRIEYDNCTVI